MGLKLNTDNAVICFHNIDALINILLKICKNTEFIIVELNFILFYFMTCVIFPHKKKFTTPPTLTSHKHIIQRNLFPCVLNAVKSLFFLR